MPLIPLVCYGHGPGAPRAVGTVDRPAHVCAAADRIIAAGLRFEVERLHDGHLAVTVSDDLRDYAAQTAGCGGQTLAQAVDALVAELDLPAAIRQRRVDGPLTAAR